MPPPLVDVEVVGLFTVRKDNGRDYLGEEPIIALYVQLYLNAMKEIRLGHIRPMGKHLCNKLGA